MENLLKTDFKETITSIDELICKIGRLNTKNFDQEILCKLIYSTLLENRSRITLLNEVLTTESNKMS